MLEVLVPKDAIVGNEEIVTSVTDLHLGQQRPGPPQSCRDSSFHRPQRLAGCMHTGFPSFGILARRLLSPLPVPIQEDAESVFVAWRLVCAHPILKGKVPLS